MSLKLLTFTALPPKSMSAIDGRRERLVERLQEQKLLLENSAYRRKTQHWTKINGQRQLTEKEQRVYPWWRTGPNGFVFAVRASGKPIEFEKGKAGIAVPTLDKLPGIIDTLVGAVRNGELDGILTQASKARTAPKKKVA